MILKTRDDVYFFYIFQGYSYVSISKFLSQEEELIATTVYGDTAIVRSIFIRPISKTLGPLIKNQIQREKDRVRKARIKFTP